jgi:fluoride ion exporter CrcB/FEX
MIERLTPQPAAAMRNETMESLKGILNDFYPWAMFTMNVIQTIWLGALIFRSNEERRNRPKGARP